MSIASRSTGRPVRRSAVLAALALLPFVGLPSVGPARAAPAAAAGPTVVELFTSQSCSSCPPADALLAELARTRPDLLLLDLHVTYWDRLGWKDPFSLPQATQRQRNYAAAWKADTVYTPQLVAGGRHQAVGSDRAEVLRAIAAAAGDAPAATLRLARDGTGLLLEAGAGTGRGTLILVGYDPAHTTRVAGGENGGRTLSEVNVVRSLVPAGGWAGAPVAVHAPVPAGERTALLLQGEDGRLLAAAVLPPG